ncbi:MAG: hypothetical protein QW467_07070 [Candidatus Caldarchaeum sp.]
MAENRAGEFSTTQKGAWKQPLSKLDPTQKTEMLSCGRMAAGHRTLFMTEMPQEVAEAYRALKFLGPLTQVLYGLTLLVLLSFFRDGIVDFLKRLVEWFF